MDIQKLIDGIKAYLQLIFSGPLPSWILQTIWIILGLTLIYFVIAKVVETWNTAFAPIFYKPEEKRRSNRRRRFAQYIVDEVARLDRQEEWSDYRFADLEAEIEAEGRWRPRNWFLPFSRVRTGLRREKSLSSALETSKDHIILLVGDPGSGKSISLRHLTNLLAKRASGSKSTKSRIPIYVNLRGLKSSRGKDINKQLIKNYTLRVLNRANDRDIEEFLDEEFDRGIEEGTWLFLFDSFDEIPDILSSTEADDIIAQYSGAITDFLNIMNNCRGIIASRHFRGPSQKSLPTFHILPLSERRQLRLIQNAELPVDNEKKMRGELSLAGDEIRTIAGNPMFLGLLCDYMKTGNKFPENSHIVFEAYVTRRLDKDQERLRRRFDLQTDEIRSLAENVAFCMTADIDSGLSPKRISIMEGMNRQNLIISKDFHKILDALEFIKLARSENEGASIEEHVFTFAHRRFQEYFATCIVLKEPNRVNTHALLTDARWRDTCVTLCQTQPLEKLVPLLIKATNIIIELSKSIKDDYEEDWIVLDKEIRLNYKFPRSFSWPRGLLHILGLLQDGFSNRLKLLPDTLREVAGKLLVIGTTRGNHLDKKWTLEVARVSDEKIFHWLIDYAFSSKSQWLQNIAYQQLGRVQKITTTVEEWIRGMLIDFINSNRFVRERFAIYSFLARLPNSEYFLGIYNHLLWTIYIDTIFFSSLTVIALINLALQLITSSTELSLVENFIGFGIISIFLLSPLLIWKAPKLWDMPTLQMRFSFATSGLAILPIIFSELSLFSVFTLIAVYVLWLAPSVLTLTRQTGKYTASKNWFLAPFFLLYEKSSFFMKKIPKPKFQLPISILLRKLIKFVQFMLLTGLVALMVVIIINYWASISLAIQSAYIFLKSIAPYISLAALGIPAIFFMWHLSKFIILLVKDEKRRKQWITITITNIKRIITFSEWSTSHDMRGRSKKPAMYSLSSERSRFNRWRKGHITNLNVFQFLDAISYGDIRFSFLALAHIREHNLLQMNLRSEQVLELFVQHLENALSTRRVKYNEDDESLIIAPPNFVLWLLKYQRSFGYLNRLGVDFLDEASKLLEEIKKKQVMV